MSKSSVHLNNILQLWLPCFHTHGENRLQRKLSAEG